MKTLRLLVAMALLGYLSARAADWLNAGGDASHSGWQKRERYFTPANVKDLKLLWKRPLDDQSRGANALVGPVMLGPIITHRGIKELVFVAGASDTVYAVDADLGRVFWKRQIEVSASPTEKANAPCGGRLTAAPAIEPDRAAPPAKEDDDYRTSIRPLYVLASDGRLHKISPATGMDMGPGWAFLRPDANAVALTFQDNVVTAETRGGCGGVEDGLWSIRLHEGSVERREAPDSALMTKWEDANHVRWAFRTSANRITGYQDASNHVWDSPQMISPKQPVVAEGVLYVLSSGNASAHARLYAFDARTGRQLYSSGDAIGSFVRFSGLALANGHLTFATDDNTLYCFGFPLEI